MEALKIILLCVAAAILYGIGQDLVTTRVSLEYFTIGHPPIFGGTENPTLLALGWGVLATWWVGVLLGAPAALLARVGSKPKLGWRDMRVPLVVLMGLVAVAAVVGGLIGYLLTGPFNAYYFPERDAQSTAPHVSTEGEHGTRIGPSASRVRSTVPYVVAAGAHNAAYLAGFAGGVLIWGWIWWKRGRTERRLLHAELERLRRENAELLRNRSV